MTYTELSNAIQAYTENISSAFVTEIPVFVTQAEQRIDRKSTRLNSSHVSESRMPSSA